MTFFMTLFMMTLMTRMKTKIKLINIKISAIIYLEISILCSEQSEKKKKNNKL
jgi:hypothetical protein